MKKFFDIKLLKFIFVGILNTIVGNGLMLILYNTVLPHEIASSAVSYILASVMSYFLNKYFTFKNKEKGIKPVLRFSLNIAVCYILAYVVCGDLILKNILNIPSVTAWIGDIAATPLMMSLLGGNIEKLIGNIVLLGGAVMFVAFNYFGQRFFAFKEPANTESADNTKS